MLPNFSKSLPPPNRQARRYPLRNPSGPINSPMSIRRRIQTSCEIRSTKSETNLSHGLNTDETLIELFAFPCFVRVSSVAQICFGFRASNFGFFSEVEFHDIFVMLHVIACL